LFAEDVIVAIASAAVATVVVPWLEAYLSSPL